MTRNTEPRTTAGRALLAWLGASSSRSVRAARAVSSEAKRRIRAIEVEAGDLAAAGYVIVNEPMLLAAAMKKHQEPFPWDHYPCTEECAADILAAIAAPAAEPPNEWAYQRTRNGGAPYEPGAAEPGE